MSAAWAILLVAVATAGQGAATPEPEPVASTPIFRDVTEAAGVDFISPLSPEKKYILESVSGGVALLDYNRDGLLDVYLVNSLTVATAGRDELAPSALYRNDSKRDADGKVGPWKLSDQAKAAGVAGTGWGVGVCVADVDGNGFPDLYVTGVERNRLFLNSDGETFADATKAAGVAGGGWSTGCGFADADRDGDLDLFVARYLDLDLADLPEFGSGELCQYRGIPVQCGPRGLPGKSDLFFRNNGDGTFSEAGAAAGLADEERRFGLGVSWLDVDGDGWQDLYVANDTKPNDLYLNRKDGTFENVSYLFGAAVSEDGREQGSMGIAVGDYLNEGRLGLFVTNFSEEYNTLYRNREGAYFTDESFRARLAAVSLRHVGWGTSFADVDNDGWLDLVVVNGHVYPQIDDIELEASAPYRQRRMLFMNRGAGSFEEVVTKDDPLTQDTVSRGLAVGDLDNDGRLDLVINDLDGKAQLLRNETPATGHWLLVRLEGRGEMTDAVGALITVRTGKEKRIRPVRSGTGYLSQDDFRQHFGLGQATKVDTVEVLWPDGSTSKREGLEVDRLVVIRQPKS
ncbi:MAG: CRTAC1 family protein [bacterium]|nr:CRTAC1 family protein [bacterium]